MLWVDSHFFNMKYKTIDNVVEDLAQGRIKLEITLHSIYPDNPQMIHHILMQYDTTSGEYIKQYASDDKQADKLRDLYKQEHEKKG